MIDYQQLPKTGFFLFVGKYYHAKNPLSIPFCPKKTGGCPIIGLFWGLLAHFKKGWLRTVSAVLGV
jgi:hypothetical protein